MAGVYFPFTCRDLFKVEASVEVTVSSSQVESSYRGCSSLDREIQPWSGEPLQWSPDGGSVCVFISGSSSGRSCVSTAWTESGLPHLVVR